MRLNSHGAFCVQNVLIHTVCRDAIKIVEKTLVTDHAWPKLHRAAAYKQQVLLDAVKPLIGKDKHYKDVQKRITRDDDFVKVIGKWVCKIIIHLRPFVTVNASFQVIDTTVAMCALSPLIISRCSSWALTMDVKNRSRL